MLLLGVLLVISTAWSGWHEFIRHATSDRMRAVSGQIEHFSARIVRRAEAGLPSGPGIMVEQLELEFSARYEFAGRGYQASRYSLAHGNRFTPGSPEAQAMSEVIAAWTPGGRISLWVDPEQPALAVIDKRVSPEDSLPVGSSSFRVEHNSHNDSWSSSPVGMCAGRWPACAHVHRAGLIRRMSPWALP